MNILKETREKVLLRLEQEDTHDGEGLTDEEYYYCVGKAVNILMDKYDKANIINKFIDAKNIETLKIMLVDLFKKSNVDLPEGSRKRKLLSLVYGYTPSKLDNHGLIELGFVSRI